MMEQKLLPPLRSMSWTCACSACRTYRKDFPGRSLRERRSWIQRANELIAEIRAGEDYVRRLDRSSVIINAREH